MTTDSSSLMLTLIGHTSPVRTVAISPDGQMAASGSGGLGNDHCIRFWDLRSGHEIRRCSGHLDTILSVAFSPNGELLLSGSKDGSVRLWDCQRGQELRRMEGGFKILFEGHNKVEFSPDGLQALSTGGDDDRTIHLWSVGTGRRILELNGHRAKIEHAMFVDSGRAVLAVTSRELLLHDLQNRSVRWKVEISKEPTECLAVSPDGRYIAGVGSKGNWTKNSKLDGYVGFLQLWNMDHGIRTQGHRTAHELGGIRWFSRNLVVSSGMEPKYDEKGVEVRERRSQFLIWDVQSWKEHGRWYGPRTYVGNAFTTSADGRYVLSGHDDCQIRYWRIPASDSPDSTRHDATNLPDIESKGVTATSSRPDIEIFLRSLGLTVENTYFDDCSFLICKEAGFQMRFDAEGKFAWILLQVGADGYRPYAAFLPEGLTLADRRQDVEAKLGQAETMSGGGKYSNVESSYKSGQLCVIYDTKKYGDSFALTSGNRPYCPQDTPVIGVRAYSSYFNQIIGSLGHHL